MRQETLYDKLRQYCQSDVYPFHMPGHKRNSELLPELLREAPYLTDITEIDGFDNLHHAEGVLREAQQRAAKLYGARESFFLVNGSTCGILAAVYACTAQHGKILMARNCHKAAYHAVQLRELSAVYLYPGERMAEETAGSAARTGGRTKINGPISPEAVEEVLGKDREIQAILITSPTYDGVTSDVRRIAQIAHRYGKPLIVDEAHGAHFGFHPCFPESSLACGADVVIHSLHKTLPSLTQTALLHTGKGGPVSLVDSEKIREALGIFETSSPSYVFMAGMDCCVDLISRRGAQLFDDFAERLLEFRREIKTLRHVRLLGSPGAVMDPSKLLLEADGYDGHRLAELLREKYRLEMEMEAPGYVIALTSVADTQEGFDRLLAALREIDREETAFREHHSECEARQEQNLPLQQKYPIARAAAMETEPIPLLESPGRICGEYVYLYPPGIPLAVPGEILTEDLVKELLRDRELGLELQGIRDHSGNTIRVIQKNEP